MQDLKAVSRNQAKKFNGVISEITPVYLSPTNEAHSSEKHIKKLEEIGVMTMM